MKTTSTTASQFIPGHLFHDGIGIWVDADGYPAPRPDRAQVPFRGEGNEMKKQSAVSNQQLACEGCGHSIDEHMEDVGCTHLNNDRLVDMCPCRETPVNIATAAQAAELTAAKARIVELEKQVAELREWVEMYRTKAQS
jgi:hypothetical protein